MEPSKRHTLIRRAVGLEGIEVYGHIGFFPEERKMGRLFRIDVYAEYTTSDIGETPPIDYRDIARMVNGELAKEGVLIEHVAQALAELILDRWTAVEKVRVVVHKVHPPIGILAKSAYAYVEMERH
ncbi:MAG: dihydroneopterin aldolase [Bacteroidia bacterium]|nr:dihydroneopterin aldolase [Bacteroidia bacterium]